MPGILPMKVIKVGNSSQSRIAQACDRCRSKKIRCDGIRPCCSQCANVGFECKTSDKLSRRAFPRGYTESLEERVRALEAEVRELKDLLDEKDEKIDMLSKMHSHRRASHSSMTPAPTLESREVSQSPPREDTFRVQASPLLLGSENSDSYFMGASSGRSFVDAFKCKMQESGKPCSGLNMESFLLLQDGPEDSNQHTPSSTVPPRLFSDRCVNIFFQEWAPLFPVIHRPTFLRLYEEYVTNPESMKDNHKLALLHLVFSIAALSSGIPDKQHIKLCEHQWHRSLDAVLMSNTLPTLQLLVLATLYCISSGEYKRLQHYKGIAVGLSHRLGLHQSQKRFSFGTLTIETRKKVFWSLYTVDCFSAAMLGLPKLLKEEDVHCEFPADIDDEYLTEKGFLPTLPGESSKVSNSLALFRASRILCKVLDQNYPAAASHDLSLQQLSSLEAELNEWSNELPQHLKLTFTQDKPSTNVTGSRSALLSLAYYYIKSLIHRPAVGSTLGNKASSSVISLAESSKHIVQIVQLLDERNMTFSFCLNRNETLALCGLSLLYQGIDLKPNSSLVKDAHILVNFVVGYLEKHNAPGATDLRNLAASMAPPEGTTKSRRASENSMPAPHKAKSANSPSQSRKETSNKVSKYSPDSDNMQSHQERLRRATLPNLNVNGLGRHSNNSQSSIESATSDSSMSRRDYRHTSATSLPTPTISKRPSPPQRVRSKPNLDYMSLTNTPSGSQPQSPLLTHRSQTSSSKVHTPMFPTHTSTTIPTPTQSQKMSSVSAAEWESLLSSLDNGQTNIYDAVYGGPAISLGGTNHAISDMAVAPSISSSSIYGGWSPEQQWDLNTLSMHDFDLALNGSGNGGSAGQPNGVAQSVLSFSEESLSSGDDLVGDTFPGVGRPLRVGSGGKVMVGGGRDGFLLDGLDGNFGL